MIEGRCELGSQVHLPRMLQRDRDGGLVDTTLNRSVTLAELAGDVKDGRFFRASRTETGASCTNEVLLEVLRTVIPDLAGFGAALDAVAPPSDLLDQLTGIVDGAQLRPERPRHTPGANPSGPG